VASRYTFGDSDLAVRRMDLVAQVFEPTSRALLAAAVPAGVDVALDLGCGPGHTTRLLAAVARPRRTVGVDGSERYLAHARAATADHRVDYICHDVTALPLPGAPVDAIYARLLLAHLPDPLGLVERWRSQLRPGGVLVLDDVEDIDPPAGVLRDYEQLVVALVAAEGGPMYAGRLLAPLGGRCVEVHVEVALAAHIFGMNLASWRDDALARGLADADRLDDVADRLAALADSGTDAGTDHLDDVAHRPAAPADSGTDAGTDTDGGTDIDSDADSGVGGHSDDGDPAGTGDDGDARAGAAVAAARPTVRWVLRQVVCPA
jgi:SAM-dependent methyltransferase